MFQESKGPTALRADIVRALAFSVNDVEVDGTSGAELSRAGLAAVWNGEHGYVAVLIRSLTRPVVRRFAFTNPLESLGELDLAIENGLGFAADLGFMMDAPVFSELPESQREERQKRWNWMRKPKAGGPSPGDASSSAAGAGLTQVMSQAEERELAGVVEPDDLTMMLEPLPEAEQVEPVGPPIERGKGSVLGRIALVRQDESQERPSLLARLLAFF